MFSYIFTFYSFPFSLQEIAFVYDNNETRGFSLGGEEPLKMR